jgi:hypothetical protein
MCVGRAQEEARSSFSPLFSGSQTYHAIMETMRTLLTLSRSKHALHSTVRVYAVLT